MSSDDECDDLNQCFSHLKTGDEEEEKSASFFDEAPPVTSFPVGCAVRMTSVESGKEFQALYWEPIMEQLCVCDGRVVRHTGAFAFVIFNQNLIEVGVTIHRGCLTVTASGEKPEPSTPLMANQMTEVPVSVKRTFLDKGHSAFASQRYDEAILMYSKALELDDNAGNHSVLANRSATWLALENYEKALNDALQAIQVKSTSIQGYVRAANVYRAQKKYAEANQYYQMALRLDPASPDIQYLHKSVQVAETFATANSMNPISVVWLRKGNVSVNARTNIAHGATVFVDEAAFYVTLSRDCCANCGKVLKNSSECISCGKCGVCFCGLECQQIASVFHAAECTDGVLSAAIGLLNVTPKRDVHAMLRLLLRIVAHQLAEPSRDWSILTTARLSSDAPSEIFESNTQLFGEIQKSCKDAIPFNDLLRLAQVVFQTAQLINQSLLLFAVYSCCEVGANPNVEVTQKDRQLIVTAAKRIMQGEKIVTRGIFL